MGPSVTLARRFVLVQRHDAPHHALNGGQLCGAPRDGRRKAEHGRPVRPSGHGLHMGPAVRQRIQQLPSQLLRVGNRWHHSHRASVGAARHRPPTTSLFILSFPDQGAVPDAAASARTGRAASGRSPCGSRPQCRHDSHGPMSHPSLQVVRGACRRKAVAGAG